MNLTECHLYRVKYDRYWENSCQINKKKQHIVCALLQKKNTPSHGNVGVCCVHVVDTYDVCVWWHRMSAALKTKKIWKYAATVVPCCALLRCVGVYMIAKATCTSIENWTNFRDCRTHNNFNEVKVFKLVLFSLFDKNIQYLVATGISSNEIQMPFWCWWCCCCCRYFHWKIVWKRTQVHKQTHTIIENTLSHTHSQQLCTGNIRLWHKYNM